MTTTEQQRSSVQSESLTTHLSNQNIRSINKCIEEDGTGIKLHRDTLVYAVYLIHTRATASALRCDDPEGLVFSAMAAAAFPLLDTLGGIDMSTCRELWEAPEFTFNRLIRSTRKDVN